VIFLIFSSSIRSWFIAAQLLGQCPNIDYVVRRFCAMAIQTASLAINPLLVVAPARDAVLSF
jgi:hypothetical protein